MAAYRWCGAAALALAAALTPAGAPAQPTQPAIISPAPATTSVTVYRGPHESPDANLDPDWLQGYALITETRDVTIPAGHAVIAFGGVAAGMLPESAIITGLPSGVREKNLDADLLSPRNLYARSFGRPVTLRRENGKTGKLIEEPAIIRSAPDGAVILQTAHGFEAANCGALNDSLAYPALPPGLTARPTLSVSTDAAAPTHVRLSLSYLAWGFDWRAHYVLAMAGDGEHADLAAWVTLANGDPTSFADAGAAVVAGKPNFDEERADQDDDGGELVFHCFVARPLPPPPPPPPPMLLMAPAPAPMLMKADIIVTAQRARTMAQENLGDLKLYRVPMPTTVTAHAQKQVALFDHRQISLTPFYKADLYGDATIPATVALRLHNRKADGLGMALPAGRVSVLEPHGGQLVPVGEADLADKAVGESIDLGIAPSPSVHVTTTTRKDSITITVSNANPWPITFEGGVYFNNNRKITSQSAPLTRKDGHWLWTTPVPANGRATLHYRLVNAEPAPRHPPAPPRAIRRFPAPSPPR